MRLSTEAENLAAGGIGVLGAMLGDAAGLLSTGGDVVMAFILGLSGAAGGYVAKELINAGLIKIKKLKK